MRQIATLTVIYFFCLYDIYLYLPDVLGLIHIDFYPPDPDVLTYFDATMMLIGGIVTGIILLKLGGRFNKYLGAVMIVLNVLLTPFFIFNALP